jgi:hypothetical protein
MANLFSNLIPGIIASVVTLILDRLLRRYVVARQLRTIAGNYKIINNFHNRNTSGEHISVKHKNARLFSISSTGGPVGEWTGFFTVHKDYFGFAQGTYHYVNSHDWGQHELLIDFQNSRLLVYGINRSKPGLIQPFSLVLERLP